MNALAVPLPSMLAQASTPAESKHVETVSASAMAYYYEQGEYEKYMQAWRVYLLARRKTTELVQAFRQSNTHVSDMPSFTPMQWSRRLKEAAIEQERIDAYFDELMANGWQPSLNELMRRADGKQFDRLALARVAILRAARTLIAEPLKMTEAECQAAEAVIAAFGKNGTG